MSPKLRVWVTSIALILLLGWPVAQRMADRPEAPEPSEFAREIDLSPLESIAVQHQGRFKSYFSFANEFVGYIAGPRAVLGQRDEFTYLDLIFRPDRYADKPIVYVKHKPMRVQIASALGDRLPRAEADRFIDDGLIAPVLLVEDPVQDLMERWSRDLIRTAKHVNRINNALTLLQPAQDRNTGEVVIQPQQQLVEVLRIVPPARGTEKDRWLSTNALFGGSAEQQAASALAGLDPAKLSLLRESWSDFVLAWRRHTDPREASEALATFCSLLPTINPDVYPSQDRMKWESWYFSTGAMTWVWLIYLLSIIFLLMSVVYRWNAARFLGMGTFLIAFGLHTFAIGLRWYVSGRWPNSNMFEAVTTAVWFGALLAIGLEVLCRRTPLRNLFALTAACASMVAMMAASFIPELDANINNRMPILYDIWLYIHTNVIIASYALIAMAAVTGTLYLLHRLGGGPPDYARAGGAAGLIERTKASLGSPEHKASKGEVFDGATMILMELAFVLLWAGIVMGAIWADHSWGRPWGWDPKEVFALNTFLVFLILVHVRLKVRDKGLWTAVLAICGCAVMLFNWIVINFVISGLHSYA